MDPIQKIATAIQRFEGWFAPCTEYPNGTLSFQNNNPGNLRFTKYTQSLGGSIGKDGFAKFATYEIGLNALMQLLKDAFSGSLAVYKPTMTLLQFFSVYAPSSNKNSPMNYAVFVSQETGISLDTVIGTLIPPKVG